MNGSALMGGAGSPQISTLRNLLLITSLWCSVYWRGHSSANRINHHFAFLPSLFQPHSSVLLMLLCVSWKKKWWEKHGVCVHLCRFPSHLQLCFFFQSHSLIVSTQLYIITMLSWVVIIHFGDFIFILVIFGQYTLDEYMFFFPNWKTRINFLVLLTFFSPNFLYHKIEYREPCCS